MQDEYTGTAGTFVTDPDTGTRMPLAEWQAKQNNAAKAADAKTAKQPAGEKN